MKKRRAGRTLARRPGLRFSSVADYLKCLRNIASRSQQDVLARSQRRRCIEQFIETKRRTFEFVSQGIWHPGATRAQTPFSLFELLCRMRSPSVSPSRLFSSMYSSISS